MSDISSSVYCPSMENVQPRSLSISFHYSRGSHQPEYLPSGSSGCMHCPGHSDAIPRRL
ncbi:hypothetical protein BDM02DRAFT_3116218 [Thelephora ganbajun]|uniref:Uncharacterized protein n=1 Tax=Thelephora ganbajun TaxID=370292 RepID=A0ACB6ZED9_THEGA|nr:hypothetical protein BDM02DRAFT_3116218 [Thelephora ganbajun]